MQTRSSPRNSQATEAADALAAAALVLPLALPFSLPADFAERATDAAELLKALANPDRLLLLCQLVSGEKTVTELGLLASIEQPSLSQQLAVLRGERLVATRREGKSIFYSIASPAALAVLETLYRLFCTAQAPAADDNNSRQLTPTTSTTTTTTTGRVMRPRKDSE